MRLNSRYVCKSVSCNANVWPGGIRDPEKATFWSFC